MFQALVWIRAQEEARNRFYGSFKHVGSLIDWFNSCQLHINYTKYVKLSLSNLWSRKTFSLFAWWHMGRGGIIKKVTKGDIGGGGSKIWHFRGGVIFEWSLMLWVTKIARFFDQFQETVGSSWFLAGRLLKGWSYITLHQNYRRNSKALSNQINLTKTVTWLR